MKEDDWNELKNYWLLCEFSGTVREAFAKKGWDAWSCQDLLPRDIPSDKHIQGRLP